MDSTYVFGGRAVTLLSTSLFFLILFVFGLGVMIGARLDQQKVDRFVETFYKKNEVHNKVEVTRNSRSIFKRERVLTETVQEAPPVDFQDVFYFEEVAQPLPEIQMSQFKQSLGTTESWIDVDGLASIR